MNALIARYTHAAHVIVDGLLGATLIIQPFAEAHGQEWVALGLPQHWVTAIVGGLLVASQLLRRASALLEAVDPQTPAGAITITGAAKPPEGR